MTRSLFSFLLVASMAAALGGCGVENTKAPDYAIRVMPSADGKSMVAVPPECPNNYDFSNGPWENQYRLQLGCATSRNLAAQVANKKDLVAPKAVGDADATYTAATVKNYRAGRTKALINPWNDQPTASPPASSAGETK